MPLSRVDAIEEMLEHFWSVWNAASPTQGLLVQYDNLETADVPPADVPYAEVMIVHTTAPQQTFGAPGGRRFRSYGQFIVIVHIPTGSGRKASDDICTVLTTGFQGKQTGPDRVTFRNPVIQEVGRREKSATWDQNFICAFDYDEIA